MSENSDKDVLLKITIALATVCIVQLLCILYSMESDLHDLTTSLQVYLREKK